MSAEREQALTACPKCGSGRLVCCVGAMFDACLKCHTVWERLPLGEPYLRDGEPMPFQVPCDNCAFRGGSQERSDAESWQDMMQMLSFGGEFYCHKGVPLKQPVALEVDGKLALNPRFHQPQDDGFDFPRLERRTDIAGKCQTYLGYDTANMRLCRGYLNKFVPRLLKELADA